MVHVESSQTKIMLDKIIKRKIVPVIINTVQA